jgi:hypothetical protein
VWDPSLFVLRSYHRGERDHRIEKTEHLLEASFLSHYSYSQTVPTPPIGDETKRNETETENEPERRIVLKKERIAKIPLERKKSVGHICSLKGGVVPRYVPVLPYTQSLYSVVKYVVDVP